jgi:DNA-binding transcriptional LysR family regulator
MTIEQLEAFIAAAESESFVAPGGKMHRYSSSKADEIITLEKELDCHLFEHDGMNAGVLSEAGEALLPLARNLVHQYHTVFRQMSPYRQKPLQTLYIGTQPILKQYRLTAFFRRFQDANPDCSLYIEEADAMSLLKGFSQNLYDALVILADQLVNVKAETIRLAEDEVAAVLPEKHPLANQAQVNIHQLKNEAFFLSNPHSTSYSYCKQLLIRNHISTENVHTADIDKILQVVRDGRGIAFLPISSLNVAETKGVRAIPLSPRAALSIVLAINPASHSPYLSELKEKAAERARSVPAL